MAKRPAELLKEYARTASSETIRANMKKVAPDFEEVIASYREHAKGESVGRDAVTGRFTSRSSQASQEGGNGHSASPTAPKKNIGR